MISSENSLQLCKPMLIWFELVTREKILAKIQWKQSSVHTIGISVYDQIYKDHWYLVPTTLLHTDC